MAAQSVLVALILAEADSMTQHPVIRHWVCAEAWTISEYTTQHWQMLKSPRLPFGPRRPLSVTCPKTMTTIDNEAGQKPGRKPLRFQAWLSKVLAGFSNHQHLGTARRDCRRLV
jgi:hypothetical protein